MDKEKAIKYLKRRDVETSDKNIDRVMKEGKIFGDPIAEVQW